MTATGTGADRVKRRRDKLKAAGFAQECARQSRIVCDAESRAGHAEHEFWSAVSDTDGWTA